MSAARLRRLRPYAIAAAVSLLPFLGVLLGGSLYFRDLSNYFFPVRQFVAEGLRHGELRFWNPYVYEGSPLAAPPVSYPLELLQVLAPSPHGLSLWLILHVPLSAVAFVFLARRLSMSDVAAVGGATAYALGGFSLSLLNLYVYPQAFAWAPIAIALLIDEETQNRQRAFVVTTVVVAVLISTTAVEIVGQALVIALALGAWRRPLRSSLVFVLAGLLAAPTLAYMAGTVADSARGAGFATEVALANAVYPLTLMQTLIADFHGDLSNVTARWWGQNFFPRGFPYVLSLYLGASLLALAVTGLVHGGPRRRRLGLILLVAVWIGLGRWGGLEPLVEMLGPLRKLRSPVKAFFSVQLAASLLATMGIDALVSATRRTCRTLAIAATLLGAMLVSVLLIPSVFPGFTRWFVAGFFDPATSESRRALYFGHVLADAATGGALALVLGVIAVLALRGNLSRPLAATAAAAILAADLLRAGASLNPVVPSAFFALSPEMSAVVEGWRHEEPPGRVFTCSLEATEAYFEARARWGDRQDAFTFAAVQETLTPYANVARGVPSALGADLTMLVPESRVSQPRQLACDQGGPDLERLRQAGVRHLISVVPLTEAGLTAEGEVHPTRVAPLALWLYAVDGTSPLDAVARDEAGTQPNGRVLARVETPSAVDLTVEAEAPGHVVLRRGHGRGWSATVDGRAAPIAVVDPHTQAVAIPAGRSRIRLGYRPPHVVASALVSLGTAVLLLAAVFRRRG